MRSETRVAAFLRHSAALVATVPVALYLALAIIRWWPASDGARLAFGYVALVPLWVALACVAVRARSGGRAWIVCIVATAVLRVALAV